MSKIENNVKSIVNMIENDFVDELNSDNEPMSAFDYISEALDIEYIISSRGDYLGARILVAFGGPNIWIDTRTNEVEGYWWNESSIQKFRDNAGLDDAAREIYECTRG